ncbi:MAG: GntR family transcriptional regulator [Anaerolineae bacterium]|nr:GntR family transcriptional regulator [Anaerolineae bacterium]
MNDRLKTLSRLPSTVLGGGRPRYRLLAESIIADIAAGRYPVGSLLPTESELAEQYAVSRHTVREALRRLHQLDMVASSQGVGTRVRSAAPSEDESLSVGTFDDLWSYANRTQLRVDRIEDVIADEKDHTLLGCEIGQRWLHIEGVRIAPGKTVPICASSIYIDAAYSTIRERIAKERGPLARVIAREFGESIREILQEVRAVRMPKDLAARLCAAPGAPALEVTRRFFGRGVSPFEVSISIHPADRFVFATRMRRSRRTEGG